MNRKNLEEIIKLVDKALLTIDEKVINTEVDVLTKTSFVSMGGILDSIKILATDNLGGYNELRDAIDRPERHSIAGHMNDSDFAAKRRYEAENGKEAGA